MIARQQVKRYGQVKSHTPIVFSTWIPGTSLPPYQETFDMDRLHLLRKSTNERIDGLVGRYESAHELRVSMDRLPGRVGTSDSEGARAETVQWS